MGKADLHIHTSHGDGLDSVEAVLEHADRSTDLDVIAITEHDDLAVALRAREAAVRHGLRIQVVAGVETTTLQGHLVALFLEEPVPSLRRIEETVEAVRRLGGLCFVPHPLNALTRSVGKSALERLSRAGLLPDGIELSNRRHTGRPFESRARRLNGARYRLAEIGSSDAHWREAIGSAYTNFEGAGVEQLRHALVTGAVTPGTAQMPSPSGVKRRLKVLALPVSGLRATPRKLGWRRTAWSFVARYAS